MNRMQRHKLMNGGILLVIVFLGFTLGTYFWQNHCRRGTDLNTNHSFLDLKRNLSHRERTAFNTKRKPPSFLTGRTCTFPNVDPFDPAIIKIAVGNKTTLRCDLDFMPELTYIDGRNLKINTTQVDISLGTGNLSHCRYRNIRGGPFDYSSVEFSDWSKPFSESVALEEDIEFIEELRSIFHLRFQIDSPMEYRAIVNMEKVNICISRQAELYDCVVTASFIEFD
ncbi:hypothetical protein PoB_003768700 [Plakobranchus ocellatus]|uniref:Uncharacterized protein n=1 Tax=Plakobranchus ocellatus TaxID=259542 RepID=A0AAV4AV60_9GAST|nr:hypothetical protein PoB_003768700 [Plakobranchus ocellatus]